jgi:hypothetical protein
MSVRSNRRLLALLLTLMAAVALPIGAAGLVTCPAGEPNFPYLDAGNDGCFDVGTDTEIPQATLFGAAYDATGLGSIVVPVKAKLQPPAGTLMNWAADGIYIRGKVTVTEAPASALVSLNEFEISGNVAALGAGASVDFDCVGTCTGEIADQVQFLAEGPLLLYGFAAGANCRYMSNTDAVDMILFHSLGSGSQIRAFSTASLVMTGVATVAEKCSAFVESGPFTLSSTGPTVTVGAKFKATATDVSLSSSAAIVLGEKASLKAESGSIVINSGGVRDIGAKAKLVADGDITIGGGDNTLVGEKTKIIAAGYVSLGNAGTREYGDKVKIKVAGNFSDAGGLATTVGEKIKITATTISMAPGGGNLTLGPKAKLTATAGQVFLNSGADISIDSGGKIAADSVSCGGNGALTIADKTKIKALVGGFSASHGGVHSVGNKVSIRAANGITIGNGNARSFGDGVLLDGGAGVVSVGGSSTTTLGLGCDVVGTSLILTNSGDRTIGAGSALLATGGDANLGGGGTTTLGAGVGVEATGVVSISNAGDILLAEGCGVGGGTILMSNGGSITVGQKSSLASDTGGIDMSASATLHVEEASKIYAATKAYLFGTTLQIDAGVKIAGAELADSIELGAQTSLDIMGASLTGAVVNIGGGILPINPFLFQNTKITGDGGASTVTFNNLAGTCDVTGTQFKNTAPTYNCLSVVGP